MMKALPLLWLLVAALGAAVQLSVAALAAPGTAGMAVLSAASALLSSTVTTLGIALVYLLILRTRPSLAVAIIGYSHLFLAIAARVAQTVGSLASNRYFAGHSGTDMSNVTFAYTAAGLASILGGIVFILALIVALNTHHVRPEDVF